MIRIIINGGLGNQMFQYAIGRAISLRNKTDLKLDISWYTHHGKNQKRNFELNKFNINSKISGKGGFGSLNKILIKLHLRSIIKENAVFKFNKEILKNKNAYLDGYWQNENYFKDFLEFIRNDFSLKNPPSKKFILVKKIINRSESVALHVRRGDYVLNKQTNIFHGVCPLEYYNKAVTIIKSKLDNPVFFIFSDDIEWTKNNLNLKHNVEFISDNKIENTEELVLMSFCKHQIIANSSFSWWGAYLNTNKNKIVIAPKKWLNSDEYDTSGIIPNSWIKI